KEVTRGRKGKKGCGFMWTGWDWTWWSAPFGPYLPRERVTAEPVVGEVEWKDSFGWAKADAPIDHHCFKQRGGRIYVHKKDVTSGAITTGCRVRFHVYKETLKDLALQKCRPVTFPTEVQGA
ncbi:unnamed protein product, partial [Effrenium voratum]